MPMIDLTIPAGSIAKDKRDALVDTLTGVLLRLEGAPDNERSRGIAWVFVDEKPVNDIYVGGKSGKVPVYRMQVTVPEKALDADKKNKVVAEFTSLVLKAAGEEETDQTRKRVWCIIREVPDGNWGGGGQIFTLKDVARYISGAQSDGKKKELENATTS
jgi:phenylpyruvate tautomerase PptA (4-oxalocrotonate tautomerase family)